MKIKGFWHIYMINHWYSIVIGQLNMIVRSGLYQECEEIQMGCIGENDQMALFQELVVNQFPKLKLCFRSDDPVLYEFPTIELIEKDTSDYIGFYFHTKACTKPTDILQNNIRELLNKNILDDWQKHFGKIFYDKCDISSVNFLKYPDHFSGNFWWFNRRYVDTLPKTVSLDHSYRWHAEQWICMSKDKKVYSENINFNKFSI